VRGKGQTPEYPFSEGRRLGAKCLKKAVGTGARKKGKTNGGEGKVKGSLRKRKNREGERRVVETRGNFPKKGTRK